MWRTVLVIFSLLSTLCQGAERHVQDKITLSDLDNVIRHANEYDRVREERLDSCRTALMHSKTLEQKYLLYFTMRRTFDRYRTDSATFYAVKSLDAAKELGRQDYISASSLALAKQYMTSGMSYDALATLNRVDRSALSEKSREELYLFYMSIYESLEGLSIDESLKQYLLWNWNIWAAEGYDPEATAVNADGNVFMDRNLGAVVSGLGTTGSYEPAGAVGDYYQWGRKDPFPSISDYAHGLPCQYSNTLFCVPTYTPVKALQINGQSSKMNLNGQMFGYRTKSGGGFDIDKAWNLIARDDISSDKTTKNGVYVSYATEHPYKYIKGGSFGGVDTWINGDDASYKSLWGDAECQKTLYDPCPAGWRVSSKDEAEKFLSVAVKATMSANKAGYEYLGHYIPLTSSRDSKNSRVDYVGLPSQGQIESNFWTSTYSDYYRSYVYMATLKTEPKYAGAFGNGNTTFKEFLLNKEGRNARSCPVRCIKE